MKERAKTWKTIAAAWASLWRAFAGDAKADPKLVELMNKAADALEAIEKYIEAKEKG